MQCTQPTLRRGPETLRLLGSSALLLLYLVTATPLAAALTALLATSDRSHHVAIQQAAQGLQIVLRHDRLDSPTHQHGLVARALTAFAQRTTAPHHADHIIQFGASDTAQRTPALALEPAPRSPALDALPTCDALLPATALTDPLAAFPRPPPAASGRLLVVRSTVLLI